MENVLIKVTGYEKYFIEKKELYTLTEVLNRLEDVYLDNEILEEELHDLKRDIEDNYKPITPSEQVGVDYRDFIWERRN